MQPYRGYYSYSQHKTKHTDTRESCALREYSLALRLMRVPLPGTLSLSTRHRIVVACRLDTLGSADSLLWAFLGKNNTELFLPRHSGRGMRTREASLRPDSPGEIPRTGHQYKSTDAIASVLLTHVNKKIYFPETREFRAKREYSHALRLENVSLREPLSDLRAANANPQCKPCGLHCRVRFLVRVTNTKAPMRLHRCF